MKKILIILSLLLAGAYFSQAIILNLFSGDVLFNSSWQEISNITDKINLNSNNLNINGKLVSSGKVCAGNSCLGECNSGKVWDSNTSSCIGIATTPETAGETCETILAENPTAESGYYYIKPSGYAGDAFQVYCDMTNQGGGWTLVAHHKDDINPVTVTNVSISSFGVMQDAKWVSVRNNMTTGMMFIDEYNRVSMISKAKLSRGSCVNINSVSNLRTNTYIYHNENSGCGPSGGDFTLISLKNIASNGGKGAALTQRSVDKFDVWPYNFAGATSGATNSQREQNELKYYVK